jgi:hypothetical protein
MKISVSISTKPEGVEAKNWEAQQNISFELNGFPEDYTMRPLAKIVSDWLKQEYIDKSFKVD